VFSPGRGLVGFPQEKLRWRIKSQEDVLVWVRRQATCQTDFSRDFEVVVMVNPTPLPAFCLNVEMNKKHVIKRFSL